MRPPRRDAQVIPERNEPRVNERIRIPRVLVVDDAGEKLGEMDTEAAILLARERGLDLVEVAPLARPPVCRITDFGKLKYEKKKREAEARRHQTVVEVKEIKLRPKTDDHDFDVKERAVRRFLDEGNKVKITVRFRGREIAHKDIGEDQCRKLADKLGIAAVVEMPPRMDGKQLVMLLAPGRKKPA